MNNDFVENVNITLKEYERLVAVEKKLSSMVKQAKENGTPPGYAAWKKTFGIYFGEKEQTSDIKEPEETNIGELTKELARLSSENRELRNKIKNKRLCKCIRNVSLKSQEGIMYEFYKGDTTEYKDHGTVKFIFSENNFIKCIKEKNFYRHFIII